MKKNVGCIVAIVAVLAILAVWFVKMYNGLVTKDEAVSSAWSQVENVYQRRMDLIPNLVNTVKGAADFEQSTLQEVVAARAAATQVKIDPSQLTEENIAKYQQAQDALSSSLSRLLVSVERYPDLKATQNFRDLHPTGRDGKPDYGGTPEVQPDSPVFQHEHPLFPAQYRGRHVRF